MASVPKQKRDKSYTATLEWLIGDLLTFIHFGLGPLCRNVSVTSDSGSVMVKAAEIVDLNRVACIAQYLHSSVNAALEKAEHLSTLVDKCHDLAKFFHFESDWDLVEEVVRVLRLMSMNLIFSSTSKGLAANLYPWVASVRDELDIVGKFRQAVRRELKERFHLTDLIQTASVSIRLSTLF
ncbi:hypothetical protein BGZ90_003249 [Linnemannia elongata]|nr:hypothetical protein BGZ90_003249 [Linnemannia elongata]